jgi:hypothetical protein
LHLFSHPVCTGWSMSSTSQQVTAHGAHRDGLPCQESWERHLAFIQPEAAAGDRGPGGGSTGRNSAAGHGRDLQPWQPCERIRPSVRGSPGGHTGGVPDPVGWNGNLSPLGPPGSPLAEKTTVAGAQAKAGYPVPVPSTPAASPANLTHVWVNGKPIPRKERQVALVFDNGKVDILMHRATHQSALRYFHAFIAEKDKNGGVTAEIGQVNGRSALVIWPGTNYSRSNPAVVIFWRNGVFISISSNTKAYGTHTLLAIAESMH